ncbi:MAG TPA: glycogen/starch/alpha-glucan family phosphorylase [Rhabdochlamydiaceae bacterium]|nr:glycogen/starch/alpha-glucan family phosphorylase [Rhabdochlamydiaceae bacterium]
MTVDLEIQSDNLIHKVKHYLITTMGVTLNEATNEEFYRAFSLTLREEIMINWTASAHTYKKNSARILNYLCMEYLPGRRLGNNVTNINAVDLVKLVMKKMNRSYEEELLYEADPGLGNGGLGRLASCLLDSLATQQYPARAYGLRYQYGIFDQEIWNGVQVERPEIWLLHENPWEFRRDTHDALVNFAGRAIPTVNKKGVPCFDIVDQEEVRALSYDNPIIGYKETADFNVVTLRLWTTKESPRNFQLQRYNAGQIDQASENSSLTDVLYPNDNNETGKRIRLKQEFLLVSASLQDIIHHHLNDYGNMSSFADKVRIQINDTHPALVIAELMRLLIHPFDFSWEEAYETVQTCCSYTNHTILKESLEEWNQGRVQYLLPRQYQIIERLNLDFCNAVRKKYPGDEERVRRMSIIEGGQVRMAKLAIYGCHKVNGVSQLHTEILKKEVFKDFYEMFPDKFIDVTNGVTQRRWVMYANPRLAAFFSKRIGKKWIEDFNQIRKMESYASDPESQQEFLNIKKENKKDLIAFLRDQNPIRDFKGKIVDFFPVLDEEAMFDVQIKRIHEYKRQLMNVLHLIMIYHELKADPEARKINRMVFFAGKAAPGYEMAKQIIQLIFCLAKKINSEPNVSRRLRVAFVEDYNVSNAERIIPAADLSEQISCAGSEASGTGNMKLAMNGALTIATKDGSNIEMQNSVTDKWWPFSFGSTAEENAATRKQRNYNPWDIYMHNLSIRQAVDALRDHSLAESEAEHGALSSIYHSLLESQYSDFPDRYFVLKDLESYYNTQKKVEELYLNPTKWAEYALNNIAAMGPFSIDESVHKYAKFVWDLEKCPVDKEELKRVREEYSEHDKCRIF